jgi:hypothetical protein
MNAPSDLDPQVAAALVAATATTFLALYPNVASSTVE